MAVSGRMLTAGLFCLAATMAAETASAQSPASGNSAAGTTPPGWNLRWRKSDRVAPQAIHVPQQDVFATPIRTQSTANATANPQLHVANRRDTASTAETHLTTSASPQPQPYQRQAPGQQAYGQHRHVQQRGVNAFQFARRSAAVTPTNRHPQSVNPTSPNPHGAVSRTMQHSEVRHVNYQQPAGSGNPQSSGAAQHVAPANTVRPNDLFHNPFGAAGVRSTNSSSQMSSTTSNYLRPHSQVAQAPAGDAGPTEQAVENLQLPPAEVNPPREATLELPAPAGEPDMRSLLQDTSDLPAPVETNEAPLNTQPADTPRGQAEPAPPESALPQPPSRPEEAGTDSPSDQPGETNQLYGNPFKREQGPGLELQGPVAESPADSMQELQANANTSMIVPNELSCEDFRARIARETIDRVTLDISPPFRPDIFDPEDFERQKEKFDNKQSIRQWNDLSGTEIGNGRLVDLAYEQVIIETEAGEQRALDFHELSEGDLGYISENWGLPKECRIEQVAYTEREWTPLTMTWKASNVCSKTRYFEQVNLERYGHSAGPVLQPIVSSAHFFANIAIAPYKMGIHPPNECHYALGYYRPGSCAPWITQPFPISPRGAVVQGAVMTGAFWLIP